MGSKFIQGGEDSEQGPSSINVEKAKSSASAPEKKQQPPAVGPASSGTDTAAKPE